MWVTKLLTFPVQIRIFCPKTTKFGPKLAFLVILVICCPVRGLVGGCGARALSRKTPIYFIQYQYQFMIFLEVKIIIFENYLESGNKYAYLGSPGPVYSIADECGRGTEGKSSFIISLGNVGPLFHSIKLSFFLFVHRL